jgi:hypothetical protein
MPVQSGGNGRPDERADAETDTTADHMQTNSLTPPVFKQAAQSRHGGRMVEAGENSHEHHSNKQRIVGRHQAGGKAAQSDSQQPERYADPAPPDTVTNPTSEYLRKSRSDAVGRNKQPGLKVVEIHVLADKRQQGYQQPGCHIMAEVRITEKEAGASSPLIKGLLQRAALVTGQLLCISCRSFTCKYSRAIL